MDTFLSDLGSHRVDVASRTLDTAIDVQRDPRAMDACRHAAMAQGHVLALYKLARNGLKWSTVGAVPTTDGLATAVVQGIVLLLRVAQDVQACITDLGRPDRAWVYLEFLKKVRAWIGAWPPSALPSMEVVDLQVQDWVTHIAEWPNPAWAASFQCPAVIGTTFRFARPKQEDVAAFERCKTLPGTRHDVVSRLHECLRAAPSWEVALDASGGPLASLVVVHHARSMVDM